MIHLFAGPIFVEWYWEPIFYFILTSPIAAAVVVAVIVAVMLIKRLKTSSWSLSNKQLRIILLATLACWVLSYFAQQQYKRLFDDSPASQMSSWPKCDIYDFSGPDEDPVCGESDGDSATTATNDDETTYTNIKEWGIRIPRQPSDNVIVYEIKQGVDDVVYFVSSEQKAVGGQCGTFLFSRHALVRVDETKAADEQERMRREHAKRNGNLLDIDGSQYYVSQDYSGGDCSGKLKEGDGMLSAEIKANYNIYISLLRAERNEHM